MTRRIEGTITWFAQVRRRLATAAVVALVCLLGYYVIFAPNGLVAFHQKRVETEKLSKEIQTLQQDNARREQQIKALKSDPQAIEREARQNLRYARPGEIIYTLPTPQPAPAQKK